MRLVLRTSKLVESIAKTIMPASEDRLGSFEDRSGTSRLVESIAKTNTPAFEDRLRFV